MRSYMFDCFLFFVLYAQVADALKVNCGRRCWPTLLWLTASGCWLMAVECPGGPSWLLAPAGVEAVRGMAGVPAGSVSTEAFAVKGMAKDALGSWLPLGANLDLGLL